MNIRKMTLALIAAVAALALALPTSACGQAKDALIGTWRLVSASSTTDKGETNSAVYGEHPSGLITYTRGGWMSVVITEGGRKPLSIPDRLAAPVEERAQAFATLVAYAGPYTFAGDKVIHHVQVDAMQNRVNGDQVRFVTFREKEKRMVLRTPPISRGGVQQTFELVWERVE